LAESGLGHDEPAQLGRVLDPVLCLAENDAEHARPLAEGFEDVSVMGLQLIPIAGQKTGPIVPSGMRTNPSQPQHVLPTDRDVVDLFTLLGERRVTVYEGDIASLMQRHRPAMEPLLQRLQSHLETGDLTELRGIVRDIETRIARFDQHKRA